ILCWPSRWHAFSAVRSVISMIAGRSAMSSTSSVCITATGALQHSILPMPPSVSAPCLWCSTLSRGQHDMNHKARITLVDVDRETLSANQTAGENPTTFPDDSIGPGKRVKLHFALRLSDGELIDSNFD